MRPWYSVQSTVNVILHQDMQLNVGARFDGCYACVHHAIVLLLAAVQCPEGLSGSQPRFLPVCA
jgi:hypothetical protein